MREKFKILFSEKGWIICSLPDFKDVQIDIDPFQTKLFFNDVFSLDLDEKEDICKTFELIHSSVRSSTDLPGILVLEGNKTYGRKKHRLLYKCVPDDTRLQPFLIPYEMKHVGLSKAYQNMYVTFSFDQWTEKHPYGVLNQVLGPVSELEAYYEYQLYCKSLNASLVNFQKTALKALKERSNILDFIRSKYENIVDRTSTFAVYTIDPKGSMDHDDAFSIKDVGDNTFLLSIYISNVPLWIDALNLWDSFSRRIATIYLPDKKRPMLPNILSDNLCSLVEKSDRLAFYMDLTIKEGVIVQTHFGNCCVHVRKNYVYEDESLVSNADYILALGMAKQLLPNYKYVSSLRDSHDLIAYFMVLMNYFCANDFILFENGIFRSSAMIRRERDESGLDELPANISHFIKSWRSSYGQYLPFNKSVRHESLNIDAYVHITSPIRRLVDLLNLVQMQRNKGLLTFSEKASEFYTQWLSELDYINVTMRSIRKVQSDCDLLSKVTNRPELLSQEFNGYIFDKVTRNDGLNQYIVYLPELLLTSRITLVNDLVNYSCLKFSVYIFEDEDKIKKKIRLQIKGL